MAVPVARGSSQAKGRIRAAAAGLHHSSAGIPATSSTYRAALDTAGSLTPLSKARNPSLNLMGTNWVLNLLSLNGNSQMNFMRLHSASTLGDLHIVLPAVGPGYINTIKGLTLFLQCYLVTRIRSFQLHPFLPQNKLFGYPKYLEGVEKTFDPTLCYKGKKKKKNQFQCSLKYFSQRSHSFFMELLVAFIPKLKWVKLICRTSLPPWDICFTKMYENQYEW